MANKKDNATKYRNEYKKPDYKIDHVDLTFDLDETQTKVGSKLTVTRDYDDSEGTKPLFLDGDDLKLDSIAMNGKPLKEGDDYELSDKGLKLLDPPKEFTLDIQTEINPKANTKLEGLYLSSGVFTTQNEAEGFRRMTYFPDHPDMMATYTTTVRADKDKLPVLLSNGNPVAEGELGDGRHYATWDDPHPKPPSLYAMVAGDLAVHKDQFTTMSGKDVPLSIYVEKGKEDQCEYAMDSLKRSMKWDEDKFGREYDLDVFNIVAVSDFNMGAMENKGLNIFNDRLVLATPDKATDADHAGVERVVGHEYFHNWTGNRVGLESWFNLTLKEGLTSYRDQEFSKDMRDPDVRRVADVATLRTAQFPEDAGAMAHSIRPDSYQSVNNFYSSTVYKKGAEVIRMMERMVGKEGFRKGMDLFFDRHDGKAVTCDDYVQAIGDANNKDLSKFRDSWYTQAGTPRVKAAGEYDAEKGTYTLTLKQNTPPTPGQPNKKPFVMPIEVGLLAKDGQDIPLKLKGDKGEAEASKVLTFEKAEQKFVFENVKEEPVLSVNRGFTAPVYMDAGHKPQDFAHLMAHDSDTFNRWEAGQQYATQTILGMVQDIENGSKPKTDEAFLRAIGGYLKDDKLSPAYLSKAMTLPGESFLAEQVDVVDPQAIHKARDIVKKDIAKTYGKEFEALYTKHAKATEGKDYSPDAKQAGHRDVKNMALGYMAAANDKTAAKVFDQYSNAENMTDAQNAVKLLVDTKTPYRAKALDDFYKKCGDDMLMVNKWFQLQASSSRDDTVDVVKDLVKHEKFTMKNPNTMRSVISAFANNPTAFHAKDGSGYEFMADKMVELDDLNPQVAARVVAPLTQYKRYKPEAQAKMKDALKRIMDKDNLSPNMAEVVGKALSQDKEKDSKLAIKQHQAKTKIAKLKGKSKQVDVKTIAANKLKDR